MRRYKFSVLALTFLFGLVFLVIGLYRSPWATFQKSTDIKVEGEYANGVLTASGILFGIWAIVIANKPKGTSIQAFVEKDLFRKITFESFNLCLGLLILSVWFLVLTAIGCFSSVLSLLFSALSFSFNAVFMAISIQHYAVMDVD